LKTGVLLISSSRRSSLHLAPFVSAAELENAGLATAQAAPAPNNCANLRREIEIVFIWESPQGDLMR
jgi:hypothetical protein